MLSNIYTAVLDNDAVTYLQADCADFETAAIILSGTWDGEILPYVTLGELNYPIVGIQDAQTGTITSSINANDAPVESQYFANVRGLTGFGVYCNAWTSGSVTVQISLHRASK